MERLGVPAGQELLAQETEGSALYAMTQNSKCNGRIPCPSDSNNKEETRRKWDSSCIVAPPSARFKTTVTTTTTTTPPPTPSPYPYTYAHP